MTGTDSKWASSYIQIQTLKKNQTCGRLEESSPWWYGHGMGTRRGQLQHDLVARRSWRLAGRAERGGTDGRAAVGGGEEDLPLTKPQADKIPSSSRSQQPCLQPPAAGRNHTYSRSPSIRRQTTTERRTPTTHSASAARRRPVTRIAAGRSPASPLPRPIPTARRRLGWIGKKIMGWRG
jgi:hypothetical protein